MKKVVCGCFGTIYYATILKSGRMSSDKVDVTDDAINAVVEHIMQMSQYTANKGFAGYDFNKTAGGEIEFCVFDKDKFGVYDKSKYKLVKIDEGDQEK